MNASLRIQVAPGDRSHELALADGAIIWLGRDPGCDVVLDHARVSRRHAAIALAGGALIVRDHSANGTRLDGVDLGAGERPLDNGACIEAGPFEVRVMRLDTPARPEAAVDVPAAVRRRAHRMLLDRLDLERLDPAHIDLEGLRPRVHAALADICDDLGAALPSKQARSALADELADEALGLGPLERLLSDPQVSEIMVVDPTTVYVERNGRIQETGLRFTDDASVRAVIERIVTPLGRRIDESSPLVDARLPDGSRVNAIIPPLASRGPCITIRRFARVPLTLDDLVDKGSLDERMALFLTRAVKCRRNIVISGGTGSGKTTLLNVLSGAIPGDERIVTIEDAAELQLAQQHVVGLESRPPNLEGKGAYSIRDLVRNALRMRPDRIVVGECRGGEALDMLQAMNTGHEGSMTTTHANSPREAVARLETLCLMSGVELPVDPIRRQIASSVHLIVQQSRFADGSRRITDISEVTRVDEDGEVELHEIFRFERRGLDDQQRITGRFFSSGYVPSFVGEFVRRGLVQPGELL